MHRPRLSLFELEVAQMYATTSLRVHVPRYIFASFCIRARRAQSSYYFYYSILIVACIYHASIFACIYHLSFIFACIDHASSIFGVHHSRELYFCIHITLHPHFSSIFWRASFSRALLLRAYHAKFLIQLYFCRAFSTRALLLRAYYAIFQFHVDC